MTDTSTFELRWRTRPDEGSRTGRRYLDFIVDGASLQDLLAAEDLVTGLGCWPAAPERDSIEQLLVRRPPESPSGRVPIYVCGECGDLGCGAVTAKVERTPDGIRWSDFAFENSYDPNMTDVESYRGAGPFLFDESEYCRILDQRAASLPSEPWSPSR